MEMNMDSIVNWLQVHAVDAAINLVLALVIVLIGRWLANVVAGMVDKALSSRRVKLSEMLTRMLVNATRIIVLLLSFLVALSQLGVDIGPMIAGLGVAGFVVGFAMQNTLSNFAAGVMIMIYRPFEIGHFVEVSGQAGVVTDLTLVYTKLKTGDNRVITVPNNSVWGSTIVNNSVNDTRRVDMVFGIGYGDDINKARKVLAEILDKHELILSDPAPTLELAELADSSVNFVVRPWVKASDYWRVKFDITEQVKLAFDAKGIGIPYPTMDVNVRQEG